MRRLQLEPHDERASARPLLRFHLLEAENCELCVKAHNRVATRFDGGQERFDSVMRRFAQQARSTERTGQLLKPKDKIDFVAHQTFLTQGRAPSGKDFAVMNDNPETRLLPVLFQFESCERSRHCLGGVLTI